MAEDIVLEMARIERELAQRVDEKLKSQQLGEAFREQNEGDDRKV